MLVISVTSGKFYWRGNVSTRSVEPAGFWFSILMNDALFTGLLLWSVCGLAVKRTTKSKKPPLTLD
jgi:hypothetical protein